MELAPTPPKPIAAATIEPQGAKTQVPRDYSIKLALHLTASDSAESGIAIARRAFEAFPVADGDSGVDRRRFHTLAAAKPGSPTTGIEAHLVWPGRPDDERVARLRATLSEAGFLVTVRETRECAEAGCFSSAVVEWNQSSDVPRGWHSSAVCGKHSYKTCGNCNSVFSMTSDSAAGQGPSLHCEVCGAILVEWGGSKIWSAELVTRGG